MSKTKTRKTPKARSPKSGDRIASLEAQIALLEEQNALLLSQCGGNSGQGPVTSGQRKERVAGRSDTAPFLATGHQPLATDSTVRIPPSKLDTPVLKNVMAIGSQFIQVSWMPVSYTGGYMVNYSTNAAFLSDVEAVETQASVTTVTLRGLQPNTIYYVRVQAVANVAGADSDFTIVQSATTEIETTDENATFLHDWLDDLQTLNQRFLSLLDHPNGEVLSPTERLRLRGAGVRRYGYVDKVSDIAADYPQFWPAFIGGGDDAATGSERLKTLIREIEVLRNLVIAFRNGAQNAEDMLLIAGDAAFRLANFYYRNVRDASRSNIPEATNVFAVLQLFWHKRRKPSDVPTKKQVKRDLNALQNGTKEGDLYVENESDKIVKGKKVIVDNTRPKPRGGLKVVEKEVVE